VGKAGGTNRVRGEATQAGATYATIVGKHKRKNTRDGFRDKVTRRRDSSSRLSYTGFASRLNRIYQVAKQSCREDAPP